MPAEEIGGSFQKVRRDRRGGAVVAGLDGGPSRANGPARILIKLRRYRLNGRAGFVGQEWRRIRLRLIAGRSRSNLIGNLPDAVRNRREADRRRPSRPLGEGAGVIISTASRPRPFERPEFGQAAYSSSKGGIVGMTLPWRATPRANMAIPGNDPSPRGLFITPMMAQALPPRRFQKVARPKGRPFSPARLGTAEEICPAGREHHRPIRCSTGEDHPPSTARSV